MERSLAITEERIECFIPRIKVIGCGGGGSNTVQRIFAEKIQGAELIAMNTDAQHLQFINAPIKVLIGRRRTRGLGVGGDPQLGEEAAREDLERIREIVRGSDLLFITCGLGGGTGTGSAPVVAEVAKEEGILTIAVVTLPFTVEGYVRRRNAEIGLEKLQRYADTVITIPNDKLLELVPQLPLNQAFKFADEVLMSAIKGISDMVTKPGLVNLDFSDLCTVLRNGRIAMIGMGEGRGKQKAIESVENALNCPLLDMKIDGASYALVNICGGDDMTLQEVKVVVEEVQKKLKKDGGVIFGAQIDPAFEGIMRTLVVATGADFSPEYHGIDLIR